MKTQRKTELPRFIVGALATAGASAASAATVQITFAGNYVANTANGGITNLNADLPGGGWADAIIHSVGARTAVLMNQGSYLLGRAMFISTQTSSSSSSPWKISHLATVGSVGMSDTTFASTHRVVALAFTDGRINGGLVTNGLLDVFTQSDTNGQFVYLNRLIFDDESVSAPLGLAVTDAPYPEWHAVSAVPEASSSLALLALGAGGLLTRRRTKRAA